MPKPKWASIPELVMIATFFSRPPRPPPESGLRSRLPQPSSERGFTLIELLISTLLGLVVFGGILAVLETSQSVQARDTEWALTLQEGRAGLARTAREIRQASKVEKAEAGTIEFLATIGGKEWKIQYACGVTQSGTEYHECVRKAVEGKANPLPSTGAPVVRDVLNPAEVFKYFNGSASTTEPKEVNVVSLTIELPAKGTLKQAGSGGYTHRVVLEDDAFIRNLGLEG
jgi:type II secretory pathway component PulJ